MLTEAIDNRDPPKCVAVATAEADSEGPSLIAALIHDQLAGVVGCLVGGEALLSVLIANPLSLGRTKRLS